MEFLADQVALSYDYDHGISHDEVKTENMLFSCEPIFFQFRRNSFWIVQVILDKLKKWATEAALKRDQRLQFDTI